MQEPWEAGPPWRAWLLAKMGLPTEQLPSDADAFMEDAIKHLKRPNKSGYRNVVKSGDKCQAKVYVGPGDQRSMSSFEQLEDAAKQVLIMYLCTGEPPPKPEKQRRKRGECCGPQSKRLWHLQQASPATPLAELPAQPISRQPPLHPWVCTRRHALKVQTQKRQRWQQSLSSPCSVCMRCVCISKISGSWCM